MTVAEQASKVAHATIEAFRSTPVLLALMILQLAILTGVLYINLQREGNVHERYMAMIQRCLPQGFRNWQPPGQDPGTFRMSFEDPDDQQYILQGQGKAKAAPAPQHKREPTPVPPKQECFRVEPEVRDRVRRLLHEGLDAALKQHLQNLFLTWMKDPSDQPHRAAEGMSRGVKAYADAYDDIKEWDPASGCIPEEP